MTRPISGEGVGPVDVTDRPVDVADYAGAVAHYASPRRRDAVKRHWEEPLLRRLLSGVLARVDVDGPAPLRVLDVGCGAGGGLGLLDATPHLERTGTPIEYVGLDLDPHLLALARRQHDHDQRASFVHGDVRDGAPTGDVDLYLSTGVPYSHLTPEELETVLAGFLGAAAHRRRPTAVVVDVLGRWSTEWTRRWDRQRWAYRMSFFEGDDTPPTAPMSVYDGPQLRRLVARAAGRAGAELDEVVAVDRSILVGRHSATGEYTDTPPYRTLVNGLWDPTASVDPERLRVEVPRTPAPAAVPAFYRELASAWHERVAAARAAGWDAAARVALAEDLRELEAQRQRGLGVGHSLTLVAVTRPRT